jgi:hypothetical protein
MRSAIWCGMPLLHALRKLSLNLACDGDIWLVCDQPFMTCGSLATCLTELVGLGSGYVQGLS